MVVVASAGALERQKSGAVPSQRQENVVGICIVHNSYSWMALRHQWHGVLTCLSSRNISFAPGCCGWKEQQRGWVRKRAQCGCMLYSMLQDCRSMVNLVAVNDEGTSSAGPLVLSTHRALVWVPHHGQAPKCILDVLPRG